MNSIQKQAIEKKQEAKKILYTLFKLPDGFGSGTIDMFVDLLVEAAVLEIASIMAEANEPVRGTHGKK